MKFLTLCKLILVSMLILTPGGIYSKNNNIKSFTLIIDPGHGGKDIGATDNNAREKDINLGVALQLESIIKKRLKDVNIVMTRDNDTYLTLQQRADVANKAKGDLFISIHTNSVDKTNKNRKKIAGSSVYALGLHKDDNNMAVARRENSVIELENDYEQKYSGFDPSKDESYIIFEMAQKKNLSKSIKFAELTQKQLIKSGRVNRGVHQAGFWVLWATSMPSVLVELDFICNPESAKYLTSEKGQKELAESIFKAVEVYFKDWEQIQSNAAMTKPLAGISSAGKGNDSQQSEGEQTQGGDTKVKTTGKSNVKKDDRVPTEKSGNNKNNGRRRRSDAARLASNTRNVETDAIPLHSASERRGEIVTESVEETPIVLEQSQQEDSKNKKGKGGKKKSEKADKKEKKEAETKKKRERSSNSHNAKIEKFVTVYKIQILASAELLKQNNPRFQGLNPITTYKENDLYKYYYGETVNKDEINEMLKEVKKKIPDAFIVSSKKTVNSTKN